MGIKVAARPLLKNWTLGRVGANELVVDCDSCQQKCISRPALEKTAKDQFGDEIIFLCSECAFDPSKHVKPSK